MSGLTNLAEHDVVVVAEVSQLTTKCVILLLLHVVELTTWLIEIHDDGIDIFKRHLFVVNHLEDIFSRHSLNLFIRSSSLTGKFVVAVCKSTNHVDTGGLELAVLNTRQVTIRLCVSVCKDKTTHINAQTCTDVRKGFHGAIQVFGLYAERS